MHINLIIGAIFLLALWWLLRETRARKKAQKTEPAAMLKDEFEKRRAEQEKSRRASERLAELKKKRMAPVLEGTHEMIAALSATLAAEKREPEGISVAENGQALVLALKYRGHEEAFILEWDVKNFDLELFSGTSSLANVNGAYIIRMPDGSMAREEEFSPFMRMLSGLIADRFA